MAKDETGEKFGVVLLATDTFEILRDSGELAMPLPPDLSFDLGERLVIRNAETAEGFSAIVCSLKRVSLQDLEKRDFSPCEHLKNRRAIYKKLSEMSNKVLKPSDIIQVVGIKAFDYSLKSLNNMIKK